MPCYDETTLFLVAATCILLLVMPTGLRTDLLGVVRSAGETDKAPFFVLMWAAVFAGGIVLCTYHAFARREKTVLEKNIMAGFAMASNGAAGVLCGMEMLRESAGAAVIFPVVNILAGVLLIYEMTFVSDKTICDGNASLSDLAAGSVALGMVFYYCQVHERLIWPMTFSICVAYCTLVHRMFVWAVGAGWKVATGRLDRGGDMPG